MDIYNSITLSSIVYSFDFQKESQILTSFNEVNYSWYL